MEDKTAENHNFKSNNFQSLEKVFTENLKTKIHKKKLQKILSEDLKTKIHKKSKKIFTENLKIKI